MKDWDADRSVFRDALGIMHARAYRRVIILVQYGDDDTSGGHMSAVRRRNLLKSGKKLRDARGGEIVMSDSDDWFVRSFIQSFIHAT